MGSSTDDIAVMRLSEPLEFNNKVQSIPLAEKNPAVGSPAFLSGWGAMAEPYFMNYIYPRNLQGIWLQIYLPVFAEKLFPSRQNVIYAGKKDKYTKSKNVILASLKCSIFQENITKF